MRTIEKEYSEMDIRLKEDTADVLLEIRDSKEMNCEEIAENCRLGLCE